MRAAMLCLSLCTAGLPTLFSCGGGDSNLLLSVSNLPGRAVKLSLKATLDGKPATEAREVDALDQVGVVIPQSASGHLSVTVQALDSDGCSQGSAVIDVDLPTRRADLSVALQAQSPRQCGSLAPCAAGQICTVTPRPATSNLWSLWAASTSDIWAVGEGGAILHYDGTSWQLAQHPATSSDFYSVWGSGPKDVWAVGSGSQGNILHYDGSTWTPSSNGAVYGLLGVYGIGTNNVWAVGRTGIVGNPGEFWHYNGTGAWSRVVTGINGAYSSVWASSPTDIYVSGFSGVFLHGNGTTWSTVNLPVTTDLYYVWGSAPNRIFSVGNNGTILRFDGSMWKAIPITNKTYSATLVGLVVDGNAAYAVGDNDPNGNFLTGSAPYDGFTVSNPGVTSDLGAVIVGQNGIGWTCGAAGFVGYFDTRP